jgi:glycosyltransferase involved in cell wall biosynthesis
MKVDSAPNMRGRPVAIQLISTGGFYGAERTLLELATYLRDQGWDSRVVALEGDGAAELIGRAADQGIQGEAYVPAGRLGFLPMLRRLRAMLARESRAIVHSHGYKPDVMLAALGIPRSLACFATRHTWYSATAKMKAFEYLDKRALRRFDRVVAVSEEIYRDLLATGTPADRLSKIANGISAPSVDAAARGAIRSEFKIAADEKLVVQIGRLTKSKCNAVLLKALAALSGEMKIKVVLVGDGEERADLAAFARSVGVEERVVFAGYRRDAAAIMAASDLLAITSNKEGLPIVLLEAMAVGCPIVATPVGSIPDVLGADSAWIVPVDDEFALVRALREALGQPIIANERASRAKSVFLTSYARDKMGRQYLDFYERAWRRRGWA